MLPNAVGMQWHAHRTARAVRVRGRGDNKTAHESKAPEFGREPGRWRPSRPDSRLLLCSTNGRQDLFQRTPGRQTKTFFRDFPN